MNYRPVLAVVQREVLKLFRQRSRLLSAMIRPLIWLLVIGAGFDAMLGRTGADSYKYFLVPGVIGMAMLFGAMLAALSTVYDKESGVMRMLVIAPFEHYWIVIAKVLGAAIAGIIQAVLLLVLLAIFGYLGGSIHWGVLLLGLLMTALACASLGILTAAWTPTLDNYAVIMNLVIFPVFFLSGSLYPVAHLPDVLRTIASINPYTYAVDLLKHANLAVTGPGFMPDFSIGTDVAVLAAFIVLATGLACLRFSQESRYFSLIHVLAKKGGG
ncbi:MAG: ABC transporter permease [Burkholderiales bacterium]